MTPRSHYSGHVGRIAGAGKKKPRLGKGCRQMIDHCAMQAASLLIIRSRRILDRCPMPISFRGGAMRAWHLRAGRRPSIIYHRHATRERDSLLLPATART